MNKKQYAKAISFGTTPHVFGSMQSIDVRTRGSQATLEILPIGILVSHPSIKGKALKMLVPYANLKSIEVEDSFDYGALVQSSEKVEIAHHPPSPDQSSKGRK